LKKEVWRNVYGVLVLLEENRHGAMCIRKGTQSEMQGVKWEKIIKMKESEGQVVVHVGKSFKESEGKLTLGIRRKKN